MTSRLGSLRTPAPTKLELPRSRTSEFYQILKSKALEFSEKMSQIQINEMLKKCLILQS